MTEVEDYKYKTEKINEVVDNFDYERVHKAMTALNWGWYHPDEKETNVPTVARLRQRSIELLEEVYSKGGSIGSGGFYATKLKYELNLVFEIESAGVGIIE